MIAILAKSSFKPPLTCIAQSASNARSGLAVFKIVANRGTIDLSLRLANCSKAC